MTPRGRAVALSVRAVVAGIGGGVLLFVLSAWGNDMETQLLAGLPSWVQGFFVMLILDMITEGVLLLWHALPLSRSDPS